MVDVGTDPNWEQSARPEGSAGKMLAPVYHSVLSIKFVVVQLEVTGCSHSTKRVRWYLNKKNKTTEPDLVIIQIQIFNIRSCKQTQNPQKSQLFLFWTWRPPSTIEGQEVENMDFTFLKHLTSFNRTAKEPVMNKLCCSVGFPAAEFLKFESRALPRKQRTLIKMKLRRKWLSGTLRSHQKFVTDDFREKQTNKTRRNLSWKPLNNKTFNSSKEEIWFYGVFKTFSEPSQSELF